MPLIVLIVRYTYYIAYKWTEELRTAWNEKNWQWMQFQKVHLLWIFRPLFRMQSNLHYIHLLWFLACAFCMCASVLLSIQFHLISFIFEIQMGKKKFRKKTCTHNWKCTGKFIQNIRFQSKNREKKQESKISREENDSKLKIIWYSTIVSLCGLWKGVSNWNTQFSHSSLATEMRSRLHQLVNDCMCSIQMTTFRVCFRCSHSIHLKIPQ